MSNTDASNQQPLNQNGSRTPPPSMASFTKCAAGATAVTALLFMAPWVTIGSVLEAFSGGVLGVLSYLARPPIVACLVAAGLTFACFAIKHEDARAGQRAGRMVLATVILLVGIGLAWAFDRPAGMLRLATEFPTMYDRINQLDDTQREKLKSIWKETPEWSDDRHETAQILGPEVNDMGSLTYKSFRNSINRMDRPQTDQVSITGCRKIVTQYRQPHLPGTRLTVNGQAVRATSPDACRWGFNKIQLTHQG